MNAERHIPFKHPCTVLVCGPSKSGKTSLVVSILNNHETLLPALPLTRRVAWLSGTRIDNKQFDTSLNLKLISALPRSLKDIDVLVVDDQLAELAGSSALANIFTKASHHQNVSVFLLSQQLFYKSPAYRTISLNSDYLILLKNSRDKSTAFNLGRQLLPSKPSAFLDLYSDATRAPYSYLRVDNTPDCPDDLRFTSELTSDPFEPVAFVIDDSKQKSAPVVA
jgi:hypothetical protein